MISAAVIPTLLFSAEIAIESSAPCGSRFHIGEIVTRFRSWVDTRRGQDVEDEYNGRRRISQTSPFCHLLTCDSGMMTGPGNL